jgi:alkylhydroperoxidase family enzyme
MAFAKGAGLTRDDIGHTLDYPLQAEHWKEEEAVLLATIDALHDRATLTEAEFQAARQYLDDDQILEVLMLAGFYRTVSYIANSLALALEPNAAKFRDFRHEAAQSS